MNEKNEELSKNDEETEKIFELQQLAINYARSGLDDENLKFMIEKGLSVNFADRKGNTLLMLASYNERFSTTKMLLELGAEVDKKNDMGQAPLAGVAFKGNLEIVKLLIQYKADRNLKSNGGTPLGFASMFGRKDVADYLLSLDENIGFKGYLAKITTFITSKFRK